MALNFVAGDTLAKLKVAIVDQDETAYNLTSHTVTLFVLPPNGQQTIERTMTVTSAAGGLAEYQFAAGELVEGTSRFAVRVTNGSGAVLTCSAEQTFETRSKGIIP